MVFPFLGEWDHWWCSSLWERGAGGESLPGSGVEAVLLFLGEGGPSP